VTTKVLGSGELRQSDEEDDEIANWKSACAYVESQVIMGPSTMEMATSCYEWYVIYSITLVIICIYMILIWLHYNVVTCMLVITCNNIGLIWKLWLSDTALKLFRPHNAGCYKTPAGPLQQIETLQV
jgi:hypothetical protein